MALAGINSLMRDMPQLRPQSAQAKSDSPRGHAAPADSLPSNPTAHTVNAQHRVEFSQTEPTGRHASTLLAQIISGR